VIAGLSYGARTGSLAYPLPRYRAPRYDQTMLAIVLELVHPGQFRALPPSPREIAYKAELMGVATFGELFR